MTAAPPRLTAIGSGKGGTGKTVIALTLAQSFARAGETVLMLDADLGLANSTVQLGLAHGGDLPGLLAGRCTLPQAIARCVEGGFDLLSAPSGTAALADADESVGERLIAQITRARQYTRIVIDLPAGIGGFALTLAAHADDMLVVTTPDPTALTDAYAFVKLTARRTGGRMPGLVVNMAATPVEATRTAETLTKAASTFLKQAPEFLGCVPQDPKVVEAVRRQKPLFALSPAAPAATAIATLADGLATTRRARSRAPSLR